MYSRSLDPRRIGSPLPSHYSGSAFRSDGTPTPIPVRREHDGALRHAVPEEEHAAPSAREPRNPEEGAEHERAEAAALPALPTDTGESDPSIPPPTESPTRSERSLPPEEHEDAPFLSRLFSGILPGIREDDILLLLLILLLSREKGSEDAVLLLAFLLFLG